VIVSNVPDLDVQDVTLTFGGVKPLDGVSFRAAGGALTAVIGPNGAGKTSLFNCLTGVYRPSAGVISLGETRLEGRKPHEVAGLGVARTFQTPALFEGLTVRENLLSARFPYGRGGVIRNALRTPRVRRDVREQWNAVEWVVDLMRLGPILGHAVGDLAYGVMKRVELARALCQDPRLLLLDEPMAGMTYEEKVDMSEWISTARSAREMSVLLIEHDMGIVMDIAEHVVALDFGRKIGEGTPGEVRGNPAVVAAYLGEQPGEMKVEESAGLVGPDKTDGAQL